MGAHNHFDDEYSALSQAYTKIRFTATHAPRMSFNKNNLVWIWDDALSTDLALDADDPEDLPCGLEFCLVNDSSVAQTFTAGGVVYTVPHSTVFQVKVLEVGGVHVFVSSEMVVPE